MRQNLDPVITAEKCFQYVEDIGVAAHDLQDMLEKLSAVSTCIRESGTKLATDKSAFGLKEIQFLGKTLTSEGLLSNKQKIATLLKTFNMPKNIKQTKGLIGFFNFYDAFILELGEKLLPFNRLLKKETAFKINEEHNNVNETNKGSRIRLRNITEITDNQ